MAHGSATHVLALYAERDQTGRHRESISDIVCSFIPDVSAVETTRLISCTETSTGTTTSSRLTDALDRSACYA